MTISNVSVPNWFVARYVRARTSHSFFGAADNRFPATQFVISNQKQIAVRTGRASGPLSHACGLQMSAGGSQLRKIMTSVTYSRTLTRVRNVPLPRRARLSSSVHEDTHPHSLPFAPTASATGDDGGREARITLFFATFGPFQRCG